MGLDIHSRGTSMKSQILKLLPVLGIALVAGACASLSVQVPERDRLDQVHAGLTQDDVRAIAGRPGNVTGDKRTGDKIWFYSFTDLYGYPSEFDVTFDAGGHVVDTSKERLDY
jgi:outer membrane protein assembly factor BamE (lipoprotein component of BamABCDE complex)